MFETKPKIYYGNYVLELILTADAYCPNSPLLDISWETHEQIGYITQKERDDLLSICQEHKL